MKKNKIQFIIIPLILLFIALPSNAQKDRNMGIIRSALRGLEYEVKAGLNVGGASPIPLPAEIRKVNSYRPDIAISIGTNITKWLDDKQKIGLVVGLMLDTKSMRTDATVKNYGMAIIQDGEEMSGRWTGNVKTKFRESYLSIPIMVAYKFNNRWKIKGGPYFAYVLERDFSGHVYDGYLREGDPTGAKVEFKDGNKATYDFSKDLRRFQWGLVFGGEWRAFKHLSVYADLNWGLNNIFKKDFDTVTFNMYPIYLNTGFAYNF